MTHNVLVTLYVVTSCTPSIQRYVILPFSLNRPSLHVTENQTTSPMFSKSSFSVLRRYSDFLWLYETLSNNNPGVVVPPVPEKHPFGRFDTGFVERRRVTLEQCLRKMAAHPVLQKDTDFKFFLESDSFALDVGISTVQLCMSMILIVSQD